MHRSHARQLVALFTVLALLLATTAYTSHLHKGDAGNHGIGGHCDLCLQLAGSASAPTPVTVVPRTMPFVAHVALPPRTDGATSHYQPRSHRSRAPPLLHLI